MRLTESLPVSACFEKVSLTQEVCAVSKTSEGDLQESSLQKKSFILSFIDLRFIFHIIVASRSQSRSFFHA